MKYETKAKGPGPEPRLPEDDQPLMTAESVVTTSLAGAGLPRQEAAGLGAVETFEQRYYPTELSDEELMNLDFAGC